MFRHFQVLALLALALLVTASPLQASPLDATLFTTFTINPQATGLFWAVCGSLPGTSGCYGSGNLGPFGRVAAMIEGNPIQNAQKMTVTRYIYVVDAAYGNSGNQVALYIYKKVDTIRSSDDAITVTLFKTVTLPLTGGSASAVSMAANPRFLYVGTNQDQLAVQVQKNDLAITQFGAISGPYNVTSITADAYGFVSVTWGNGPGFEVIGPDGQPKEDGGGVDFLLSTIQGTLPAAIP